MQRLAGGNPPAETPISAIFVGPDTVWKLKKAVRLPFLDFTAPQARRHFVHREFDLNRHAAPALYRGVSAIIRGADGALHIAEDRADAVDWVLCMAPIPPGGVLLDHVRREALPDGLQDALGDLMAADHGARPRGPADWPSARALLAAADGCMEPGLSAGLPADALIAWQNAIHAAIGRQDAHLRARAEAGHVRRCHADAHLGNLCLLNGAPVLFDALEFDEALGTIDTGYDLAFLLMDLDLRAGRAAANRVFNRYLARTGDLGIVAPMPAFLSLRACVRAHVLGHSGAREDAARHLEAARAYLHPCKAALVAVGGLPGTGKSTLARALAPEMGSAPGAVILRSDELRKRHFGVPPEQPLPSQAYAPEVNALVMAMLADAAREVLAAGQAVIADATFLRKEDRARIKAACPRDAAFLGFWLAAPMPELERRLRARSGDASDADVRVLHDAAAKAEGAGDWTELGVMTADAAAALAFKRVQLAQADQRQTGRTQAGACRDRNSPDR